MKSTRRWFYLTGSLTVLVLGLMGVLWAMTVAAAPSGATALTEGDVSTDMNVVGPTLEDAEDRTVKVTLTNTDLSVVQYVGAGPNNQVSDWDLDGDGDKDDDDGAVQVELDESVVDGDSFRVRISDGQEPEIDYTLSNLSADEDNILPLVDRNGDGSVDTADVELVDLGSASNEIGSSDITLVEVLDTQTGLLRFRADEDLDSGDVFGLRFATSPQETALVNVRGDNGSFDLLTVENVAGPSGAYSATFVADDDVIIDMGDIMHEQHDVPSGLRGNVEINNETIRVDLDEMPARNEPFMVYVSKAPIRQEDPDGATGVVAVPVGDIDVDGPADFASGTTEITAEQARMGQLPLVASRDLEEGDEIQVSYRGSDNFTIRVNYAPVQADIETNDFVVPSNRDTGASFDSYFAIVGQDTDEGTVKIGVIVGGGDRDSDLNATLPGHLTVLAVDYDGSEQIEVTEDVPAGDRLHGYTGRQARGRRRRR